MKPRSAKNKGQRLSKELRSRLLESAPQLEPDDIIVTPSGVPGEDLRLSPKARQVYPLSFECKNTEKLQLWPAIEQAEANSGGYITAVVFKKNNKVPHIVMKLTDFLELTYGKTENSNIHGKAEQKED